MLRRLLSRVRGTFRRSRLDEELDDELREHLTMLQERFVRRGMDPIEAFYAARRQFGGVSQVKEQLMERHSLPSIDVRTLFADCRYAFRVMSRIPSFAVAVVGVLALGVGANTTMFSIVNAVLLRPLPFEEPERLVRIFTRTSDGTPFDVSPGKFYSWQQDTQSFEGMAMYQCCGFRELALTGAGTPRTVRASAVSAGFFEVVRVRPALGRVFRQEDDTPGGKHVVVLSDRFWKAELDARPDVIGRT